jgi:peptidoglycan/LPS O-acetylase OafA/YrhL
LEILDLLRGIAALAVVVCHNRFAVNQPLRDGLLWGGMGVEVFFVISGFVIPYSLYTAGYRLPDYPRYWLKRFLRLYPVFLAGLLLTLAMSYASARVRHVPYPGTGRSLLENVVCMDHFPAENPVFWTLRVEAEYYLIIGLLYPGLRVKSNGVFTALAAVVLAGAHWIHFLPLKILDFSGFFVMGVVVFRSLTGLASRPLLLAQLLGLAAWTYWTGHWPFYGTPVIAAFSGAWLIAEWRPNIGKTFAFLGAISYSVYVIHLPLGSKLINLLSHWTASPPTRGLLLLLASIFSVLGGIALYYAVERPAVGWSARVKYHRPKPGVGRS